MVALPFFPVGRHSLKLVLFANTEWYLYNFRRSLAYALCDAGHEVVLLSPPGPYGEKLRALGFRWVPAPMDRRGLNPLRELALVNWLRCVIRDEQVDIVHSFTIKCAVYGSIAARLAGRAVGVPARVNAVAGMGYVFSSNDLKAAMLRPLVRGMMHIALGGGSSRLILQNPDDVAFFERARVVDPLTIRLIPGSGVDCSRFVPNWSRERGVRFCVVLPARLLWDKGVAEYVEAARCLLAEQRAIDFLLAGEPDSGNPGAVPEEMIRGWMDEGLVKWLGHVDDMAALFASVDAVVLPSYREGLPKGLIEAGASGLPLVTTDVPGCREVVTDGVDGLLVQVRDVTSLARAIARLHDDSGLCQRLGRAARDKALAKFDERIVLDRTLAVYSELV